jgi:hypothetical protein
VPGDSEFPFDVGRIDTGSAAGYARDHWRRPQVHEHVPRFPQHDRLLAVHPVGISDRDRSFDCTHDAIVKPDLLDALAAPMQGALDCSSVLSLDVRSALLSHPTQAKAASVPG